MSASRRQSVNRQSVIFGVAMLAVAAVVCVESASLVIWTPIGPGPGFFTVILGGILGILAISVMWEAGGASLFTAAKGSTAAAGEDQDDVSGPAPEGHRTGLAAWWRNPGLRKLLLVIAALIPVPFVIEPAGYRVTIFLLLAYLLLYVERRKVVSGIVLALIVSAGSFYLFSQLLSVPLPVNAWGL